MTYIISKCCNNQEHYLLSNREYHLVSIDNTDIEMYLLLTLENPGCIKIWMIKGSSISLKGEGGECFLNISLIVELVVV